MCPGRILLGCECSLFWTRLENQFAAYSVNVRNFYGVGAGTPEMECLYPDAELWDGRMDVVGEGWGKGEIARSS